MKGKYKIIGQVGIGLIVGVTMYLNPSMVIVENREVISEETNLPRLMEEAVGQVIGCVTTGAGSVANGVSVADEASTAGASGLAGLAVAGYELAAIGVSGYPRPLEGSYMPAFLAGLSVARSVAAVTGAQLEVISHQENHLEIGRAHV